MEKNPELFAASFKKAMADLEARKAAEAKSSTSIPSPASQNPPIPNPAANPAIPTPTHTAKTDKQSAPSSPPTEKKIKGT